MGVVAVLANIKRMLGKRIPFLSLSYSSWNPVSTPILGHNHPYFWVPSGCVRPHSSGIHLNGQVATLINGKSIAEDIKSQIAVQICNMKAAIGKSPVLAVVLVGKRRDSHTFLHIKLNACDEVGIASLTAELPEDCTEDEILHVVSSFNQNPSVHAFGRGKGHKLCQSRKRCGWLPSPQYG
ncbi:hypothetical protein P3X46_008739 [Hevea brasiliensis]|uniref:Tetrahydrofolate dehydrogenase/cyclohydrolase catalytic domain-containing protein n=1 Tax=Hevea brasiliensis TaxID=3981 RepID=A0ABQ9MM86_HEVBR|nr:hypothetical protein P3X46_008739 [Hevea brasiliensis]